MPDVGEELLFKNRAEKLVPSPGLGGRVYWYQKAREPLSLLLSLNELAETLREKRREERDIGVSSENPGDRSCLY